ncbi:uncharacterized protein LOC127835933 [Dreissena polymorpha]|uniref:EF-hand domain-containing protein n=1 Tax=Dreissena polymorpha TaxID=45954 RepID=A0A9D4JNJ9_DREPO|nr:uncharacterized protein LOC127835933 [Dreissena polymorpha]KAH3814057.1 hypothetical protein DPMN_142535 [Dreissena polymorpha]
MSRLGNPREETGDLKISRLGNPLEEKGDMTSANSSLQTSAMMLRFSGKPLGKIGEPSKVASNTTEQTEKKNASSKSKDMKIKDRKSKEQKSKSDARGGSAKSISKANGVDLKEDERNPIVDDLDMEMDEHAIATFRDLFNTLDQSNTGIITADNLYEELRRVDSEITFNEVSEILRKADKNKDGNIDFDEFLFHMTHMEGDHLGPEHADEETKQKYKRRKRLFYSAITKFSIRQTLADIEKTFRKQAPHLISHYTAGARLIGLTTRQLERQMKKMQKSCGKNDSPYAKPLQFVHMGAKKIVHRKKILKDKSSTREQSKTIVSNSGEEETDTTVANLSKEINDTMRLFAEQKDNGFPKLHNANLIMELRQKIGTVKLKMQSKKNKAQPQAQTQPVSTEATTPIQNTCATRVKPTTMERRRIKIVDEKKSEEVMSNRKMLSMSAPNGRKYNNKHSLAMGLGWTTPRIQYIDVDLPSLKMSQTSEKPTFNDLHTIRAKAKEAIDAYYHNLRQTEIRNAWDHWDRLYADVVLPKKLLRNFREVYSAYSPHREEEAFVVCPWKPGPFRYIRHMTIPPTSQDVGKGVANAMKVPPRMKNRGRLVIRPLKSMSVTKPFGRSSSALIRNTPSPVNRPASMMSNYA